jgi:hypothetical protein
MRTSNVAARRPPTAVGTLDMVQGQRDKNPLKLKP